MREQLKHQTKTITFTMEVECEMTIEFLPDEDVSTIEEYQNIILDGVLTDEDYRNQVLTDCSYEYNIKNIKDS